MIYSDVAAIDVKGITRVVLWDYFKDGFLAGKSDSRSNAIAGMFVYIRGKEDLIICGRSEDSQQVSVEK